MHPCLGMSRNGITLLVVRMQCTDVNPQKSQSSLTCIWIFTKVVTGTSVFSFFTKVVTGISVFLRYKMENLYTYYKFVFFSLPYSLNSQEVSYCWISGIRLYDRHEIGVSGTFLVLPLDPRTDIKTLRSIANVNFVFIQFMKSLLLSRVLSAIIRATIVWNLLASLAIPPWVLYTRGVKLGFSIRRTLCR